ncbi:hypothetical protein SAMN02799631_03733 [Methylobacterium sp. 174MFSha1.1]|uniref:hypothetical protein n=1 Tax=Methylobacterium sp. 174MFSha1.1 TaxID=1502749 RepID=UPI0008E1DC3C|nr:hypothetical protein [Methylobacterium sp. 174MFSha1.1]SFU99551.1 hypothetical protein SAMN02799631_03733 [Methylobacterium sp. 174MFSha1.1]
MTRAAVQAALLAALSAIPLAGPTALPARAAPGGAAPACPAPQAAEFAGPKGFRLFVTRQGTMTWSNPLRPLSPETVQVLQVVIRNKLATAYGPDLSGLRRGPSPAALEAQNGATIHWAGSPDTLPPSLRILADDGSQVLAELAFQACGDPPKVAEPKAQKPVPTARKGGPKAKSEKADAPKPEGAQAEGADPAAESPKTAAKRTAKPKREKAAAPDGAAGRTPGGLMLPQGAIP